MRAPVVVVGGGPVGIVAANLLAARGVPVVVVERDRDVHPLPRAANLDDEALRILQGIGLAGAVRGAVHAVRGMQLVTAGGRVLWHVRDDDRPGANGWPQTNLFDQPAVERALRARLAGAGGRLLLGREVTGLRGAGDAVRVAVTDVATGAVEHLAADVVLGCDGARSTVRRLLGIGLRDRGFEQRWLVVDAEVDGPPLAARVPQQVCDPAAPRTFVPMGPGRYRWEFLLPDGVGGEAFLAAVPLAGRVAAWTGGRPVRVRRRAEYRFHALRAERWRAGRVFLLGDAAHQMPPFLGQGLCAGLRDAANLAWKLALVRAGAGGDALLDTYEAERSAHVATATSLTVLLGQVVTGDGPSAGALRGALRAAGHLPGPLRRRLSAVRTPGLRPGPLVLPRRRALPGLRAAGLAGEADAGFPFPQPAVRRDGRDVLLDEVLGAGFALVGLDTDPAARLSPAARGFWTSVGVRAVRLDPADGAAAAWFRRHRARVAVVRPDRYVLAACEGPGLPTLEAVTRRTRHVLAP